MAELYGQPESTIICTGTLLGRMSKLFSKICYNNFMLNLTKKSPPHTVLIFKNLFRNIDSYSVPVNLGLFSLKMPIPSVFSTFKVH